MIEDITLYPPLPEWSLGEDTRFKGCWGMRFGATNKIYAIHPFSIYPIKIRDRIHYLFKHYIVDEYPCRGEYLKNCDFTENHKALIISKKFRNQRLDMFIAYGGVDVSPLNVEGVSDEEMKIQKDRYETPFLKAEDLEDTVVTTTIDRAEMVETIRDNEPDSQEAVYFKEYEKPLVLNKTNLRTLVDAFNQQELHDGKDADTSKWVGKSVYLTVVDANNPQTKQKVKSIRISIPKEK